MTDVGEFIENYLTHMTDYDPVAAREYYLRTRKLKGRRPGRKVVAPVKRRSGKVRRVEEDQVPATSPSGAKLVDYNGKGTGRATYSDGSTYDGRGWNAAKKQTRRQRISAVQQQLHELAQQAQKIKDPATKKARLARLTELQRELTKAKNKKQPTKAAS